jgi:hypothetical protein
MLIFEIYRKLTVIDELITVKKFNEKVKISFFLFTIFITFYQFFTIFILKSDICTQKYSKV